MIDEKLLRRFWGKVDRRPGLGPNGDCWEWTGARNRAGHGIFSIARVPCVASRIALIISGNSLPLKFDADRLMACHHCDNPPCVNPDHLFIGTQRDNMRDCAEKGRNWRGGRPKTHCLRGHELKEPNLIVYRSGKRRCRTCVLESNRAWRKASGYEKTRIRVRDRSAEYARFKARKLLDDHTKDR